MNFLLSFVAGLSQLFLTTPPYSSLGPDTLERSQCNDLCKLIFFIGNVGAVRNDNTKSIVIHLVMTFVEWDLISDYFDSLYSKYYLSSSFQAGSKHSEVGFLGGCWNVLLTDPEVRPRSLLLHHHRGAAVERMQQEAPEPSSVRHETPSQSRVHGGELGRRGC